jgi:hypothetical protein
VAGSGDLQGAPRLRRRDPHQIAALVGQGEEQQAVGLVLARVCAVRCSLFEWRWRTITAVLSQQGG